jgi:hypothetical protein
MKRGDVVELEQGSDGVWRVPEPRDSGPGLPRSGVPSGGVPRPPELRLHAERAEGRVLRELARLERLASLAEAMLARRDWPLIALGMLATRRARRRRR